MTNQYKGIYYDEPHVQAEFERLLQRVREAEAAREPVGGRHRRAEGDVEAGRMTDKQFRSLDDEYIAAGNKIAAAQRAVDDFLNLHRNYKTR
jgi:hypothetical protein